MKITLCHESVAEEKHTSDVVKGLLCSVLWSI